MPVTNDGRREGQYVVRYSFAADAEILNLTSGTRLSGVTSDVSLAVCFVRTRRFLDTGTRVCLTLKPKDQSVEMLAVVRVVKPKTGMGFEALEIDSNSNGTFLRWMEAARELPCNST